ncbi:uncharacterized protein LOC130733660 [Lotus japonicus]|uniref:uncharacterized protein LOC130733653 n=1 Tax=Lotus japonicus TaxID=34305 RepID=UPI0025886A90|nr:uncharacterized protein LOC130733653 [Lotus japonicus]XP_057441865.1 uncharacterized protein LOC130733653 [Lotus japonicus]XP_057441867.1 uncharacterized protein LOC130733660 [Lotus japonicus]XP_057441869.1 uncharacterized protein LOC130733660 [Lotus japonicus]
MAVPAKVLEVCINVKRIDESNQTKIWDFILTKPIPESPPLPFQLALVPVSRLADYIQSAKRRDEFFTRPGIDDLLLCFSTFYESMDEVDSMRYLDENIKCLWSNLKKAKKPFFLLCGPEVQNCLHGESYLLIKKRNLEDNEENALTFTSMDVLAYVAITCPGSVRLVLRSYNGVLIPSFSPVFSLHN